MITWRRNISSSGQRTISSGNGWKPPWGSKSPSATSAWRWGWKSTFAGQGVGLRAGPLHLLAYHGNWYLLALNAAKGRVESFALSRFRRIEGLGRTFDRPQDLYDRAHARQAFGIAGSAKPMKIRLLFEPKLAVYISERQWHPRGTLKKRPDGRVQLRMETTGRKELVRWVLSWMPDVRVLAPKSLPDGTALKLTDGLRRNTENEDGPISMQKVLIGVFDKSGAKWMRWIC